jgi:transmembrane sensor
MSQDRFLELMSLKLSGEANPEELAELEAFIADNPDQGFRSEILDQIWKSEYKSQPINKKEAFNRHMQRLSNHLSEPVLQYETPEEEDSAVVEEETKRRPVFTLHRLLWASGVAAMVVLGIFIFGEVNKSKGKKAIAQNVITKRGSKTKMTLPDGTQVWLNSDSRISYNFDKCSREVELTGEAFFDVARDENCPFIIHTNTIDLKVLGTAFNVRSYEDEENTETSLIHGSVEITLLKSPDHKKIILKPNEKLIVRNGDELIDNDLVKTNEPLLTLAKIRFKKDSTAMETLWTQNTLAFDGDKLEEVARRIERWYDVKVKFENEEMKWNTTFTANFEDTDLQTVLEAFREAGLKCHLEGKELVFTE